MAALYEYSVPWTRVRQNSTYVTDLETVLPRVSLVRSADPSKVLCDAPPPCLNE